MPKILIPSTLRKYTGNQSNIQVSGSDVGACFENLAEIHPDIKVHLFDNSDNLKGFVVVYLGDEDIRHLDGVSTKTEEGSLVSIIPAIAGG
jgi:molybdopterin converting factor small subunit